MKTAMILAAGRGERLKPLTEFRPKALCQVHDIPVIEYHISNLAKAGFERIIINHSYLGWKIRQYLNKLPNVDLDIIYSPEPPGGLETGGGIFNALSNLGSEPFIVINADIYTDYDLSLLKLPENSLGHLVLTKNQNTCKRGDFGISKQHLINNDKELTFTGIACYHHELFKSLKEGRYSITPILREMAKNNQITGEIHNGSWFDIGTVEQLNLATSF
jgi:N-acetyl-alpha-D-muramate 1-phosphate uridylyltransferase